MSFTYRNGNIDDIEAVFRLNRKIFDEAWSKYVMLESMRFGYGLHVCFDDDTLVGYVLSQDILSETQVMQICVNADYRRKGVAKNLMLMLFQDKQDIQSFMLEVRASNMGAQAFYKGMGFSEVGVRPNYYSKTKTKPREDAVVMQAELMP
ncbi:MAG: ribosomal protein S18-alanine N-acetyltransferase [Ghiorsea sp.]